MYAEVGWLPDRESEVDKVKERILDVQRLIDGLGKTGRLTLQTAVESGEVCESFCKQHPEVAEALEALSSWRDVKEDACAMLRAAVGRDSDISLEIRSAGEWRAASTGASSPSCW